VDPDLKIKIRDLISKEWNMGDYSFGSFSEFFKKTLDEYKKKKISPLNYENKNK
jgi:broad specificity phosphatase PhoE